MTEKEIKRGNIYYADLSPVIGSEQDGIRPVLILQNDTGNKHSKTVIVAAITSNEKKELPTHVELFIPELPRKSIILLEQIRTIDKQRLSEYIVRLTSAQMQEVEQAVNVSLGIQTW